MKLWNYLFVATGISILFEIGGISQGPGILEAIGFSITDGVIDFAFKTSSLWKGIFPVLAAAALGGIIVGFITKASSENYVILPIIGATLAIFGQIFYSIIMYSTGSGSPVSGWIGAIITLVMAPFAVGFAGAAIEYFRGTD